MSPTTLQSHAKLPCHHKQLDYLSCFNAFHFICHPGAYPMPLEILEAELLLMAQFLVHSLGTRPHNRCPSWCINGRNIGNTSCNPQVAGTGLIMINDINVCNLSKLHLTCATEGLHVINQQGHRSLSVTQLIRTCTPMMASGQHQKYQHSGMLRLPNAKKQTTLSITNSQGSKPSA